MISVWIGGQQVGLAQAGPAVDKQGVIGSGRVGRHSLGCRKGKLVGRTFDEVFESELVIALGGGGVGLVLLGQQHLVGRGAGHHQGNIHVKAQYGLECLLQQAQVAVGNDLADKVVAHRQGDVARILKADRLEPVDVQVIRRLGHLRFAVALGSL